MDWLLIDWLLSIESYNVQAQSLLVGDSAQRWKDESIVKVRLERREKKKKGGGGYMREKGRDMRTNEKEEAKERNERMREKDGPIDRQSTTREGEKRGECERRRETCEKQTRERVCFVDRMFVDSKKM